MKVSVVALASRSGGGLTILRQLFDYVERNETENVWQFVLSDQEFSTQSPSIRIDKVAPEYKGLRTRIWAEFTSARKAIQDFDADIVLSLQNVDTPARGHRPLAIYMHQALPFQESYPINDIAKTTFRSALRQFLIKHAIVNSIKKSQITFVQTQWLGKKLSDLLPRSTICAIGIDLPAPGTGVTSGEYLPSHFFYPASAQPYKNHQLIHNALRLVMKEGGKEFPKVTLTMSESQLQRVLGKLSQIEMGWYELLGWVDSQEMVNQYRKSILVFPSLVESLGLPLYEARAQGIRIVAPRTDYSIEALDRYDRVFWFDPDSEESLANAMKDAWNLEDNSFSIDNSEDEKASCWYEMSRSLKERLKR